MNHDPFQWGRPSDAQYGSYNTQIAQASPVQHTQQPIVTGTSVIAIKFNKGIVIAADNLGSYGSLAKYHNVERLIPVGLNACVGISGDISDLQYLQATLDDLSIDENYDDDSHPLRCNHIHEYLSKLMYHRRSKMNPLWNSIIVAGLDAESKPFLKFVDLLGVTYSSPTLATGFGAYLALPILRKLAETEEDASKIDEATAQAAIKECMKVLFYRDARSLDRFSMITINPEGVHFEKNLRPENQSWRFAKDIKGYGTQTV